MTGKLIYLMGPSGAGKDSLIDAAREPLREIGCEVAQRVITRSAASLGEQAQEVSRREFELALQQGAFALSWQANGLRYAITKQIDDWLAAGRHVLVNGSRGHQQQARERYPDLIPILLTVDNDVLRSRLLRRERESVEDIERRLQRNALFADEIWKADPALLRLDNSGELSSTVLQLLKLLRERGVNDVSAVLGRT